MGCYPPLDSRGWWREQGGRREGIVARHYMLRRVKEGKGGKGRDASPCTVLPLGDATAIET